MVLNRSERRRRLMNVDFIARYGWVPWGPLPPWPPCRHLQTPLPAYSTRMPDGRATKPWARQSTNIHAFRTLPRDAAAVPPIPRSTRSRWVERKRSATARRRTAPLYSNVASTFWNGFWPNDLVSGGTYAGDTWDSNYLDSNNNPVTSITLNCSPAIKSAGFVILPLGLGSIPMTVSVSGFGGTSAVYSRKGSGRQQRSWVLGAEQFDRVLRQWPHPLRLLWLLRR